MSIGRFLAFCVALFGMLKSTEALSQASTNAAPSFDCTKARGRIDRMICTDAGLAALDRRLAELHATAAAVAADAGDLKKAQRKWLRDRDDCESSQCVAQSYQSRIDALTTFTGRFANSYSSRLCGLLEQVSTRSTVLEAQAGVADINNDGTADIATACSGGTANIPCATYVDDRHRPIEIHSQDFDRNTYSALGRRPFRFEDRTFIYHSRDAALAEPSHVSFVTPQNREVRVCDFETKHVSATLEGGHEVCAAIESADRIELIELPAKKGDTPAFSRSDTLTKAAGPVDIDNDGLDENMVELSYESGAGQGCTFNYFELLSDEGGSLLDNPNSRPVRELQGLGDEGYRERNCGSIVNRLFKFNDKIYFELNATNNPLVPHEVRKLEGTAVATLCSFDREIVTKVKTLY